MSRRYYLLGAVSGCVWGGIAWLMGRQWMGSIVWGGVVVSPLIGVVIARVYRPAYKFSILGRVFFALLTLYLAATLFGLSAGVYDLVLGNPSRVASELLLQGVLGTLWGLTFTGYVLFLWPLSYLNHLFLGRYREETRD